MTEHPLAPIFPNAAHFYLPDGTPACVTGARLMNISQRTPNDRPIGFSTVLDARFHDKRGSLKMPILRGRCDIRIVDGVPGDVSLGWYRSTFVRPVQGKAGGWNDEREATVGKGGPLASALAAARAALASEAWKVALLNAIASEADDLDYIQVPKAQQNLDDHVADPKCPWLLGEHETDRRAAWLDQETRNLRETLSCHTAHLSDLRAFLATVQSWREAHGAAPDPEAAAKAAAAAQAYQAARDTVEAGKEAADARAAERAAKRAADEAAAARLAKAAPDLLEALRPFAKVAELVDAANQVHPLPDSAGIWTRSDNQDGDWTLTLGQCRAARAAIEAAGG